MAGGKYYAVQKGRCTGIFRSWDDCKQQVTGFSGAVYKSFPDEASALAFVAGGALTLASKHGGGSGAGTKRKRLQPHQHAPLQHVHMSSDTALPRANSLTGVAAAWRGPTGGVGAATNRTPVAAKTTIAATSADARAAATGYELEFDGGSRGNPGIAGAGAVLLHDGLPVWRGRHYCGKTTCNVSEYKGLEIGLREAVRRGANRLVVRGDSMLILSQMRGEWAVKAPTLLQPHKTARSLAEQIPSIEYTHVLRRFNTTADSLANEAMDARRSWSD